MPNFTLSYVSYDFLLTT